MAKRTRHKANPYLTFNTVTGSDSASHPETPGPGATAGGGACPVGPLGGGDAGPRGAEATLAPRGALARTGAQLGKPQGAGRLHLNWHCFTFVESGSGGHERLLLPGPGGPAGFKPGCRPAGGGRPVRPVVSSGRVPAAPGTCAAKPAPGRLVRVRLAETVWSACTESARHPYCIRGMLPPASRPGTGPRRDSRCASRRDPPEGRPRTRGS